MYSRGYNYSRRPYTMTGHEQHSPPPLSHHPYAAYPSTRYAPFNSYSPGSSTYPPATPSSQYSHVSPYYNEPRTMEIEPREELPVPLHHLPVPMMSDHVMSLDHNCVPHVSAANCEQGNSRVVITCYSVY